MNQARFSIHIQQECITFQLFSQSLDLQIKSILIKEKNESEAIKFMHVE